MSKLTSSPPILHLPSAERHQIAPSRLLTSYGLRGYDGDLLLDLRSALRFIGIRATTLSFEPLGVGTEEDNPMAASFSEVNNTLFSN